MNKGLKIVLGSLTTATLAFSLAACSANAGGSTGGNAAQSQEAQKNTLEGDALKEALGSAFLPAGFENANKGWNIGFSTEFYPEDVFTVNDMLIGYDTRPVEGDDPSAPQTVKVLVMDVRNGETLYRGGFESLFDAEMTQEISENEEKDDYQRVHITQLDGQNYLNLVQLYEVGGAENDIVKHQSMNLDSGNFEIEGGTLEGPGEEVNIDEYYGPIDVSGTKYSQNGNKLIEMSKGDVKESAYESRIIGSSQGSGLIFEQHYQADRMYSPYLYTQDGWDAMTLIPDMHEILWIDGRYMLVESSKSLDYGEFGPTRAQLVDLEKREIVLEIEPEEYYYMSEMEYNNSAISDNGKYLSLGRIIFDIESKKHKSFIVGVDEEVMFTAVGNEGIFYGISNYEDDEKLDEYGGEKQVTYDINSGDFKKTTPEVEGMIAYPVRYVATDGTIFFKTNSVGVNRPID